MAFPGSLELVYILLILLCVLGNTSCQCQTGNANTETGKALIGATFNSFIAINYSECLTECVRSIGCRSLNFLITNGTCELNSETKITRPDLYVQRENCIYTTKTAYHEELMGTRVSTTQSPTTRTTTLQSSSSQPTTTQPPTTQSPTTETTTQSSRSQPTTTQSPTTKSPTTRTTLQSSSSQPTTTQSLTTQSPPTGIPTTQPTTQPPTTQTTTQSSTGQPTTQSPTTQSTTTGIPTTQGTTQPPTTQTTTQSSTGQPTTQSPTTQSTTTQSSTGQPTTQPPTTQTTTQSSTGQTTTQSPTTQSTTTGIPTTQPTTQPPTTQTTTQSSTTDMPITQSMTTDLPTTQSTTTQAAQASHPRSCLEILRSGISTGDGEYSIDPTNAGVLIKAYCDMTTDGGGWTIVKRTIFQTSTPPQNKRLQTYEVISEFNTNDFNIYPTSKALLDIKNTMGFRQIHFYCHKKSVGRVISIRTRNDTAGHQVARYFTDDEFASTNFVAACGSFDRLAEDDSVLGQNCAKWNKDTGTWGKDSAGSSRTLASTFYIKDANSFGCSVNPPKVEYCVCDDDHSVPLPYNPKDRWQISVR